MSDMRIPDETLAEQWYGFVHGLIAEMQSTFRKRHKTKNLSQKGLAERLGKKPSYISRCLSGQQNMTIRTIHDLARAMDCRLEISFRPLETLRPANNVPKKDDTDHKPPARKPVPSGNTFKFEEKAA
jgi:transcriptional regulator with XRE-family HTH domain